jgi:hypothetical protein
MANDAAVILNANGEVCVVIHCDDGDDPILHERLIAHFWSETKPGHALARVPKAVLQASGSKLELLKACVPTIQDAEMAASIQAKIDAADADIAAKAAQDVIDKAAFLDLVAKYEKDTGKVFDPNDMDAFDAWVEAAKPLIEPAP